MTVQVRARYENGVFVPKTRVNIPDHEEVTLTIDSPDGLMNADASDPRPEGGVALVDWRARHRLVVNEDAAAIGTDPEFDIENS